MHLRQEQRVPLNVRGADTVVPDVSDLALLPDQISPNFDAQEAAVIGAERVGR